MAATQIEQQVEELKKQGATLGEAVDAITKKLDSPDMSHLRASGDDGEEVMSYWEREKNHTIVGLDRDSHARDVRKFTTRRLPKNYKPHETWKSLGDFIIDGYRNHKHAEWGAKHAKTFEPLKPLMKAVQGMSEQVATDGGYMVVPEFNQQIMEKVYANDLFARTNQFTVAGNSLRLLRNAETSRATGSRHGGLRGYWVAEADTITKSKPTLKAVQLRLNKLAIVVYLTDELLEDQTVMEQYVSRKAAEEFNFMIGDSLFNGTGAGQPTGILNAGALLSIGPEVGQAAASILTENIDKMWARRWAPGRHVWYTNQDTYPQIAKLTQDVGTGGVVLNRPAVGISGTPMQGLNGAPQEDTEFNATLGTQGDIILADMSEVISITKGGINQAVSTHIEFLTDQTAVRFTMRMDARPWEDTPVTPFKGTNTQSSFLVLDTRP